MVMVEPGFTCHRHGCGPFTTTALLGIGAAAAAAGFLTDPVVAGSSDDLERRIARSSAFSFASLSLLLSSLSRRCMTSSSVAASLGCAASASPIAAEAAPTNRHVL